MDTRPNILFLIADDHRHDLLGAADHPMVRTPHLDRLAGRGTRLTPHHCQGGMTGAICAPSRASILTGRELFGATASVVPGELGTTEANPDVPTLPETLEAHGYHAHAVGKWHNGTTAFRRSFHSGDSLFFGGMSDHNSVPVHDFDASGNYPPEAARTADGFSTDIFAAATVDFLTSYDDHRPFFCWTAFTAPHDPRTPPGEYATLYDPDEIALPNNFMARHPFDNGDLAIRDELLAALPREPAEIRRHLADYYGMISHLDEGIGRILDVLESTGLAENTIVVYTADHGLAVGQHGLMGKQNLYDHSLRVPLIVAGPGIASGHTTDALTLHADLFPTLAARAGTAAPATVQGEDFGVLLDGTEQPHRQTVHAAYLGLQRMASDGRHKLIRYERRNGRGTDRVQLFDLAADPAELHDVARDPTYTTVLNQLTASLTEWQHLAGDLHVEPNA
ncbi:sulfatase-like hydrolase/transferase [Kribbella sp. NPDC059898]|uniref:sulfatase-like hydrolase/transferase n=1 Tax=Kribbella sp. NPDC059898 TaxID=3346995 RepID=UPI00365BACF0